MSEEIMGETNDLGAKIKVVGVGGSGGGGFWAALEGARNRAPVTEATPRAVAIRRNSRRLFAECSIVSSSS